MRLPQKNPSLTEPHSYGSFAVHPSDVNCTDVKEVLHRVKNIVAVIESISRQTMRQCSSLEEFDQRFSVRLSAFCGSLDRLIANRWRGMHIRDLVDLQLATFDMSDESQIAFSGQDLFLTATAAHSIGLALHELATNALKYGALSVPQGRVTVSWALITEKGQQRFLMSWSEDGGPLVKAPTRWGFGRKLIERLTAVGLGGISTCEFPSRGMQWTLDVPGSIAVTA